MFPDKLTGVELPIVAQSTCRRSDWLGATVTVTDNMLCAGTAAGGVDTCTVSAEFLYPNSEISGRR